MFLSSSGVQFDPNVGRIARQSTARLDNLRHPWHGSPRQWPPRHELTAHDLGRAGRRLGRECPCAGPPTRALRVARGWIRWQGVPRRAESAARQQQVEVPYGAQPLENEKSPLSEDKGLFHFLAVLSARTLVVSCGGSLSLESSLYPSRVPAQNRRRWTSTGCGRRRVKRLVPTRPHLIFGEIPGLLWSAGYPCRYLLTLAITSGPDSAPGSFASRCGSRRLVSQERLSISYSGALPLTQIPLSPLGSRAIHLSAH